MRYVNITTPLLFQSKLLCLSFLYLLTTLPLSIYISFSPSVCLFNHQSPSISDHLLFSYPSSYGEHKYSIPSIRSPSLCSSPVPFKEYEKVWQEIHDHCWNSSFLSSSNSSPVLSYWNGRRDTFAGNFSTKERMSYFNHDHDQAEVPCGFFKEFRISDSDKLAMEKCDSVVVVSAVFGDYDKIRQPKGLGAKTLELTCFFMFLDDITLSSLATYNISTSRSSGVHTLGVWRIIRMRNNEMPYDNLAMNGVIPKHLLHRIFPNAKFSVWLDAKLQLVVDPLLLLHSLLIDKNADMAISKHPFNVHTMEEAMATARWKKWTDVESLRLQMETYCENGLQPWSPSKHPYTTDVPDTALILRKHGRNSDLYSCLLFNELEAFNPRDQLAFAYVRDLMTPKININMFEVEVFEHVVIEYRHNLKHDGNAQRMKMASSRDITGSSCEDYLLKMWGESNN